MESNHESPDTLSSSPGEGESAGAILDVLVVGGGPGGTAAAFRARELGLRVLVVDYDDLMKRIRDYSKDKLILPGFGGGDKMKFPRGGPLISSLHFSPVDKDEMCQRWKGLYKEHAVPFRVGIELTGLEDGEDGLHRVLTYDHNRRCEEVLTAKTLVLALGRGAPRRFDIPGNADGIAYRLEEARGYVGRPACVVGGGTSAAEAVIAISQAKAAAGDPTGVFWSYRGDRMPRVSKALAEVFFEAYVGNGNIHYYPRSEPAAVVTCEDRQEYLAIRVDRRVIAGRPNESTQLEFPKDCCVACIGEDLPTALLSSLGVPMATGGPKHKRRLVLNRYLESRRPRVYLVGDLLSPAYFETHDFDADPAGFREVKHRGNIKAALRDGVLVAEVIAQRLAGRDEIDVHLEDAEDPPGTPSRTVVPATAVESSGPPVESLSADRDVEDSEAFLVRRLPGGVEESEHPIPKNTVTTLGRQEADITFPSDTLLSPRHASISHNEEGYSLRDDGSATGVFLRVAPARKREIRDGDLIRAGRQFLVLSRRDDGVLLSHYNAAGEEVGRHELSPGATVLGRDAPGITLDRQDRTLSRRQLALSVEGDRVYVKDLKSVNGTYLRVRDAARLEDGDEIRIGQQDLVFTLGPDTVVDSPQSLPKPPPEIVSPPPQPSSDEARDSPVVTFQGAAKPLLLAPGQTLCELAEAHGLDITAECHAGICGSDPIRILSGAEHLVPEVGDQESETLEEICELSPGECRLACLVRARGPVEVEILKP